MSSIISFLFRIGLLVAGLGLCFIVLGYVLRSLKRQDSGTPQKIETESNAPAVSSPPAVAETVAKPEVVAGKTAPVADKFTASNVNVPIAAETAEAPPSESPELTERPEKEEEDEKISAKSDPTEEEPENIK